MHIAIGADHAGFSLKNQLVAHLERNGHQLRDVGTDSTESVDYPDFAQRVALLVADQRVERGVLICGTGLGMDMTANKVRGVRCARCTSEYDARFARLHNDANVLALGARVTGAGLAESIVDTFLSTTFEAGRHARRVAKIDAP
ncbi:MAG: ribose 5-phosphate isomerase B [Acidobacteriota bacterium]|nr:MAG: ribose 5-phosphate isomerase B [Acidobacteriota bacterium]